MSDNNREKVSLILLNGGVGKRAGHKQPKQFLSINGIPILVYSLVAADKVDGIAEIIINYPEGWLSYVKELIKDYAIKTPISYVVAGESRHESVGMMLEQCQFDSVLIHEAARPLVNSEDFEGIISSPHPNISVMLPIPFTVAPVDPELKKVTGYLERDKLRNVQLPQKFSKSDLLKAHKYAKDKQLEFTEDATLCSVAGIDVYYMEGSDKNIKVTTATDIKVAGFLLSGGDKDE